MGEMNEKVRAWVGIDPGKSGAMAVIWNDATLQPTLIEYTGPLCYKTSLCDILRTEIRVVVERLFARPGKLSSAKANFELGRCMGELETMLAMVGLPFQEVTPQAWQKEFGVSGDKQTHIDCAKRLFPGVPLKRSEKCVKDFDGYADALLMAEYARRHMA